MSLDVLYKGATFIVDGTKLYLTYSGQNYYFTGQKNVPIWFTSIELEFGKFYKTQLAPYFTKQPDTLWPWRKMIRDFVFTF